jgi:hypothetical protein
MRRRAKAAPAMPSRNLRRRVSALLAILAAVLMSIAPLPAQEKLPLDKDPNDPFASKAERLKRQEALIRDKLAKRRETLDAARKTEAQERRQTTLGRPAKTPGAPTAAQKAFKTDPKAAKPKPKPSRFDSDPYVTFFLEPASVVVDAGERFVTDSGLINPERLVMQSFQIVLIFPPDRMMPVGIRQDNIEAMLKGEPEIVLDQQAGRLVYRGEFARPIDGADLALISVEWEALRPTLGSEIRTGDGERYSGAFQDNLFLSRTSLGFEQAQLGARVRINDVEKGLPGGLRFADEALAALAETPVDLAAAVAATSRKRPPTLWIDQPSEGILPVDQWLIVDFGIDNPDAVPVDEVRLACRFDPKAIQIVDTDRDNWIVRGRNLLDGPFKKLWPWDLHYVNQVDVSNGLFYYRMGTFNPIVNGNEPIVRLFARVVEPVRAPVFHWVLNPNASTEQPQTSLYFERRNLLLPEDPVQAAAAAAADRANGGYEKADPSLYRF